MQIDLPFADLAFVWHAHVHLQRRVEVVFEMVLVVEGFGRSEDTVSHQYLKKIKAR